MNALTDLWKDGMKRSVLLLVISGASLVASFLTDGKLPVDPAWIAIVICGAPILWDAVTGLVLRHDIKADVLVAMAIVAAVALGEWFAAGEVALIMEIGGFLEDYSAAKASKGVERLKGMSPKTGRLVIGNGTTDIPVDDILVGQTLRVLSGDAVPVDGVVTLGETSIDQSMITGESMPVDKRVGDRVFSGTINQMGAFDMVAEKVSSESSFQMMAAMVSSVDADKTRMVRTADRWATWLVAIVAILAVVTYALTRDVYRAVTVMIVFCPCAFILATPTAIVAAIGNLTKHGILVKDGDSLERMASVDIVAFDKTGTVTLGRPEIVEVHSVMDEDELIRLAASAESGSMHPLAKAFADRSSDLDIRTSRPESFRTVPGSGVEAVVEGRNVLIGNPRMMKEHGIVVPNEAEALLGRMVEDGKTAVIVAIDDAYSGIVALSDTIRDASAETVSELMGMGVDSLLLTGDNGRIAEIVASEIGIRDVRAGCTPMSKVEAIEDMQGLGRKVCMIGDGVNDAPALRKAWVGISMGATGSDIASDAADMVLVKDGIESIPHLVSLSRRMMSKVRMNIAFSMCWNLTAVALSMLAILGPVTGALVHNVGSVVVVVNSAVLLIYGKRSKA